MKLIFVYRKGKTFTARNVNDLYIVTGGGNVNRINYSRDVDFEAFQNTGEVVVTDRASGLRRIITGNAIYKVAEEQVSIFVNKAQLSFIIVEDDLLEYPHTELYGYTPRKSVSVIPCLDAFTGENIRDVIKTIC